MVAVLAALTTLAITTLCQAGVPAYTRHVLRIPGMGREDESSQPRWVDLNGDGRLDALGILPDGQVYVAWQRENGFAGIGQTWQLPADTAWITAARLGDGPEMDIIVSTGQGWLRYPQHDGRFATKPVKLLDLQQAYAQATLLRPGVFGYGFAPQSPGMPAVFEDRVAFYKFAPGKPPEPGETTSLERKSKVSDEIDWWIAPSNWSESNWGLNNTSASSLFADTSFDKAGEKREEEGEQKDSADRFRESLQKKHENRHIRMTRSDINGDGKPDALIWITKWGLNEETTFYLFLTSPDGSLPDKPNQVLKCRGIPADWRPVVYLQGDKIPALIIVEPRNVSISLSFAVDVFMSGKLDGRVAIRTFDGKGFSRQPVFQLDVSMTVTRHMGAVELVDDFNGDGRKDLLVWRSPTEADVYLSQSTGEMFERQPSLHFECPPFSWADVRDLNGDKMADVIFASDDSDELVIYLSQGATKAAVGWHGPGPASLQFAGSGPWSLTGSMALP